MNQKSPAAAADAGPSIALPTEVSILDSLLETKKVCYSNHIPLGNWSSKPFLGRSQERMLAIDGDAWLHFSMVISYWLETKLVLTTRNNLGSTNY